MHEASGRLPPIKAQPADDEKLPGSGALENAPGVILNVCPETKTEGIRTRHNATASKPEDCLLLSIISLLSRSNCHDGADFDWGSFGANSVLSGTHRGQGYMESSKPLVREECPQNPNCAL